MQRSVDAYSIDNARFPRPPLDEQRQIITYLGPETAKVDFLIAKKERLIKLLQENRQAAVTHAVTKELDATTPMSDSDIEWIGVIPAYWQTRRVKFLFRESALPARDGDGVVTAFRDGTGDAA